MAISRERLAQGVSYEQFVASMTRNRERLERTEAEVTIPDGDLAVFRGLPGPLEVLVIAEDWCGDVINNLPVLAKIARESGKLRLHIFKRDENPDLMDQYLLNGQFRAIPVFAFFDRDMRELGRFLERPPAFNDLRAERRRHLFTQHPELGSPDATIEALSDEQRQARQRLFGELDAELAPTRVQMVVRDLRTIVEGVPVH